MSNFSEFWDAKTQQLARDYVDQSGKYAEHCGLLAIQIARLLRVEGKTPSILGLTGVKIDSVNTKPLVPLPYEGRIVWGGHTICVADGIVYDPMLGKPASWESYPQEAFGEDVIATNIDWLLDDHQ